MFGNLYFDFLTRVNDKRLLPTNYRTFQLKLIGNLLQVGCQNRLISKFRKVLLNQNRKLQNKEILILVQIFCDYFPDRR